MILTKRSSPTCAKTYNMAIGEQMSERIKIVNWVGCAVGG